MISGFRKFAKTKFAVILVGIIIIPFVFWGMGGDFQSGNTNSIAKINKKNVSTQDFLNYLESLGLDENVLRDNVEKNILEDLLTELISNKILEMEIENLGVIISEETLVKKITKNKNFIDENNNFSRIKYEKFLLENNISAPEFEYNLKFRELRKNLFSYIGNGIKSPYFLINSTYIDQNRKIKIEYIDLNEIYKKNFSDEEIDKFISENQETLKRDYIDFEYIVIKPDTLNQTNEFNDEFFKKIDEIENKVLNGADINEIKLTFSISSTVKKNYINENEKDEVLKEIYSRKNEEKIQFLDKNDYFLLYEIKNINRILPNKSDDKFIKQVKRNLLLKEKFKYNQELLLKIQNKNFKEEDFINLSQNKILIKEEKIDSIKDNNIFEINSIKLLYSLSKGSFLLMADENNSIYLVKIAEILSKKLPKEKDQLKKYSLINSKIQKDSIFKSYDMLLNNKYKVKINENTFERIKNYYK